MTTTEKFTDELTNVDRERLSQAAGRLDQFGSASTPPSALRYAFYRRHGHSRRDALRYTLAYLRNCNEQYERRLGHDTGAEGWRPIGA